MKTWAALSETVPSPAYLYFFSHAPPHPETRMELWDRFFGLDRPSR